MPNCFCFKITGSIHAPDPQALNFLCGNENRRLAEIANSLNLVITVENDLINLSGSSQDKILQGQQIIKTMLEAYLGKFKCFFRKKKHPNVFHLN